MKRMIILALAVLLLAGCGRAGTLTDSRESIPFDQTAYNCDFLAAEFGSYMIRQSDSDGYEPDLICVCPLDRNEFIPLCAKPNCGHTDDNCNAATTGGLGFYKNRLYTTAGSPGGADALRLVSMLPDGSDRRVEAVVPWEKRSDGTYYGPTYFLFHSGRLILLYDRDSGLPFEEQLTRVQLLDLETGQLTEPFADQLDPNTHISVLVRPVGKYIYTTLERQDGSEQTFWRARLDMETDAVEPLFPMDGPSVPLDDSFTDDRVICWFVPGEGFFEYDLKSGKQVNRGLPVPDLSYVQRDDTWIYGTAADGSLYILDRNYAVADRLALPEGMMLKYVDAGHLWFGQRHVYGLKTVSAYADRAAIGSGRLTLMQLIFPEAEEPEPVDSEEAPLMPSPIEGLPASAGQLCGQIVRTDQGTYWIYWADKMLYWIPKGEVRPRPVCGRSGCAHNGADCGARLENARGIGMFRGRIWWGVPQADGLTLFSLDPETGERRPEWALSEPGFLVHCFLFHENSLLAVFRDAAGKGEMRVQLADLPSGQVRHVCREFLEQVRVLDQQRSEAAYPQIKTPIRACGNSFFVIGQTAEPGYVAWLSRIDIETGELEMLIPAYAGEGDDQTNTIASFDVTDEQILFAEKGGGFFTYDRATGERTAVGTAPENAFAAQYLGDRILLECTHWVFDPEGEDSGKVDYYFLTTEYQLLDELHFADGTTFLFATEDALYFADGAEKLLFLTWDQLGSGGLTLNPIT